MSSRSRRRGQAPQPPPRTATAGRAPARQRPRTRHPPSGRRQAPRRVSVPARPRASPAKAGVPGAGGRLQRLRRHGMGWELLPEDAQALEAHLRRVVAARVRAERRDDLPRPDGVPESARHLEQHPEHARGSVDVPWSFQDVGPQHLVPHLEGVPRPQRILGGQQERARLREAVDYAWDFVTNVMELEPARLWATVNEGDPLLGLDEDAIAIAAWERVGIPPERIVRLGKDNFWQAAETGPCGQCSEIFYDRGDAYACGDPACGPGALRPLHGDLQPRLHGVRPAAGQQARAAARPERRHRPRPRADDVRAAGRRLGLRHRRVQADHGLGRAGVRRRLPRQRDLAARPPRPRRPRPRRQLPDRRRRRPLERGPRLHLPPPAPPRDPAGAAHRPRPHRRAARRSSSSRWATPGPS